MQSVYAVYGFYRFENAVLKNFLVDFYRILCYAISIKSKSFFSGGTVMHLKESGEMYLETIYILSQKSNAVRSVDVGEYMGFSKPSVSRAMGILKNGGFVKTDAEGFLLLTDAGLEVAQKIYERHTMLTDFLIKLGVSKETAAEDACKMEHDISDETFEAMKRHAGIYTKG